MDLQVSESGPCKKRVTVTIPAAHVDRELKKSLAHARSKIALPGFRPGRVPAALIEKRFGEHLRGEVLAELLQDGVENALKELSIEPVSQPKLVREDAPPSHMPDAVTFAARAAERVTGMVTEEAETDHVHGAGCSHDHDHDHDGHAEGDEEDEEEALLDDLMDDEEDAESEEAESGASAPTLVPGMPLAFTFEVEFQPDFELPAYDEISAVRKLQQVTPADIDRLVEIQARRLAEWRPVADGEVISVGDQVGGSLTVRSGDAVLVDSNDVWWRSDVEEAEGYRFAGLHERLAGAKVGDVVALVGHSTAEDPGREVTGSLAIESSKRLVVPAIDDDMAVDSGFTDLEALRENVRGAYLRKVERAADHQAAESIVAQILSRVDVPLAEGPTSQALLERERRYALERMVYGKKSEDEVRAELAERRDAWRAELDLDRRRSLLLQKISKKEKLFCLEEDVDEKLQNIANDADSTPSKVRAYYEKEKLLPELRLSILEEKVVARLLSRAKVTTEIVEEAQQS